MTIVMAGLSAITTLLLLILRKKSYGMSWRAVALLFFVVGIVGYFGASLASYLSYGTWKGIRFYGKVLFVTIAFLLSAEILKDDWFKVMDYYAPIDICALIIMKINCVRAGCCAGIELISNGTGSNIIFPSQYVELIVAIVIFLVIMVLEVKKECNGFRYAIYIIVYGVTRFALDILRAKPGESVNLIGVSISITKIICLILVVLGILLIRIKKQRNFD